MSLATLTRHYCPNSSCGWYRDYDPQSTVKIIHPKWGTRLAREIAALEIRHHNCVDHLQAVARATASVRWYRSTRKYSEDR